MPVAEINHSGWNGPRRCLAHLAGPAILLAICIGFYWKLVLTGQFTWLESPDMANQVLPWFQYQAGEWHKGRFPLWDPHLWAGQSLIGQAQPGTVYPLNWILFLMPLKEGWIRQSFMHWYFVVIHWMGAVFCYWLCRDLRRSRGASILAGAVFGLGGYLGTTDWPAMLNGAVWAPLVFLFLLRALRGERPLASAAAAGALLGVSWLGGHHQVPIFVTIATGAVWLYFILRGGRPDWRLVRLAAVFAVFLALTGALQTLPAYEYGRLAKRWVSAQEPVGWKNPVPYTVHSDYSLYPISVLGMIFPGIYRHAAPFVGVTALAAALLGLGLCWKQSAVRLFSTLAAGGLLVSLGKNSVLHGVLYGVVPLFEKARNPSMAIFIFHLGLVVLIAYGIDACLSERTSQHLRRAMMFLVSLGVFVFAMLVVLVHMGKWPGDDRAAVTALAALLAGLLLWGIRAGHLTHRAAVACAVLLVLVELGNNSGYYYPHREEKSRTIYLKKMREHADIAEFLRREPFPLRIEVPAKEIPYNFGDWYGIDVMGGYLASLSENLLRLPYHHPRGRYLFAVNYTVNRDGPGAGQTQVFESASGLRVHKNVDAWPRAWAVREVRSLRQESEIAQVLNDESFDLRRRAFVLGPAPELESCAGEDQVQVLSREPNRVVMEARMGCRGLVVLADNYFPGWRATVDGRRAKVYEAYTVIRGIVVERGVHRIEMVYRPLSATLGGLLSALGLLGAAALAWRSRRGGQRTSASPLEQG